MKQKLKIIYLPFLLLFVGLWGGYSLITTLLFSQVELSAEGEQILTLWLPILLTLLGAWFIINPRLKVLKLKERGLISFTLIAWLALFLPLVATQKYIAEVAGKNSELVHLSDVAKEPSSRFYTIENYFVDKQRVGSHINFTTQNNQHTIERFFVMPLFDSPRDTTELRLSAPLAWLGVSYATQMDVELSKEEKDSLYEHFLWSSLADFKSERTEGFRYFERVKRVGERECYREAMESSPLFEGAGEVVLSGAESPFEQRGEGRVLWIGVFTLLGLVGFFVALLFAEVDRKKVKRWRSGNFRSNMGLKAKQIAKALKPQGDLFVTPILLYIHLGLFVAMVVAGVGFVEFSSDGLVEWGANYGPQTRAGEWWRLLTAIFLHSGVVNLLVCGGGLLLVGYFLEGLLGRWRFLIFYLMLGVLSSMASVVWNVEVVAVGDFGAVLGLMVLFLVIHLPSFKDDDSPRELTLLFAFIVVVAMALGLRLGLDNAAHLGGIVSGLLVGLIAYRTTPKLKAQGGEQ